MLSLHGCLIALICMCLRFLPGIIRRARQQHCFCLYSCFVCPSTNRVDGRSVLEYVLFISTLLLQIRFHIPWTESDISWLEHWDTDRVAVAQDCRKVPLCLCLDWPNAGSVLFRCLKVAIRTIGGDRSPVPSAYKVASSSVSSLLAVNFI